MKNRVNSSEKVNWPWRYSVRKEGSSAPHSKRRKRLSCRLLSLLPLHSREMRKASNKTEDFITDNFNSKLRLALLSAFLLFGGALTYFIHNTYDFPLSIFAGKQLHFRVSPTCSKGKSSPGRAQRAGRERARGNPFISWLDAYRGKARALSPLRDSVPNPEWYKFLAFSAALQSCCWMHDHWIQAKKGFLIGPSFFPKALSDKKFGR